MNYKPGDKFILEIKSCKETNICGEESVYSVEGISILFAEYALNKLERLDSDYINEHYGELQNEAYAKGREDGFNDGKETGYFEGIRMAWDLARRLFLSACDGVEDALSDRDLNEIFETRDVAYIVNRYTPDEIKSRIEAWEKSKAEIKVGDVVKYNKHGETPEIYVVTHISENAIYSLMNFEGRCRFSTRATLTKTGRTIDIASVLGQIGGSR